MSSTESRGGWAGLAEGLRPHSAEGVGSVLGGGGVPVPGGPDGFWDAIPGRAWPR